MVLESVFAVRMDLFHTQGVGAVWHKHSHLALVHVCPLPFDKADKIRTLEQRRDGGNYTSSPAGRPGDSLPS